ncbi:hypothetical protein EmuJ_000246300 [Echinococcus multilocularis]|uniref:Uncharacterized protein n=1 Tax=Echinococcus multilocularis TaxID=6211 RepID=A0A087W272_ECHMU|nr:hypothetical protein EmuJ_000246300 [Echinococcus multilocularis]
MKDCKGIDSLKTDYPPKRSCCFNRSTGCTHEAVSSDERELSQPCQKIEEGIPCLLPMPSNRRHNVQFPLPALAFERRQTVNTDEAQFSNFLFKQIKKQKVTKICD